MKRTYYGFQLLPTFAGALAYVGTRKPANYQVKCRARNVDEARRILNQKWFEICAAAMIGARNL